MIKLFNLTDTSFVSNRDKIIIPTKAKIHKEDNGAYYLDLECSLDYINYITQTNDGLPFFLDVEAIKKYEVA